MAKTVGLFEILAVQHALHKMLQTSFNNFSTLRERTIAALEDVCYFENIVITERVISN